jgi:hypothetical protein
VADRLELALYCLNSRVLDGAPKVPAAPAPSQENPAAQASSVVQPDASEKLN